MLVFFSSSFRSTSGVKMMRRVVIRLDFTSFTSSTDFERSPKRMVPSPGSATLWPSVAHALMTSPAASQQACITPKAFYDILKEIAHKFGFEYPEDKLLALSTDVKKMIDDKSKYTDWANRTDIKAELQMDLILILAEHGYPPVPQDDVFKEIFEQAENFKKYEKAESEEGSTDVEELAQQMSLITAFTDSEASVALSRPKTSTNSGSSKASKEIRLKPSGSMLDNVEKDDDVRRLIHNMMELYEGTTIMQIIVECQKEFQERYFSMKGNEWRHLIRDYVREVTENPHLQDNEVFRFIMAG